MRIFAPHFDFGFRTVWPDLFFRTGQINSKNGQICRPHYSQNRPHFLQKRPTYLLSKISPFSEKNLKIFLKFNDEINFSPKKIGLKMDFLTWFQKMPWAIFLFHFYASIFEKNSCHQNFFENFRIFHQKKSIFT